MAESFLAFFLVAIFVSIIFSVRGKRYSEELNQAIDRIEKEGADMESFSTCPCRCRDLKVTSLDGLSQSPSASTASDEVSMVCDLPPVATRYSCECQSGFLFQYAGVE